MSIDIHKAVADTGGAIGTEITSGVVDELFPEVTQTQQTAGVTTYRKFYLYNNSVGVLSTILTLEDIELFSAILFESSGDSEVVGDLTGSETNESPITIDVPALGHKSFWIKMTVPSSSTETSRYNRLRLKLKY